MDPISLDSVVSVRRLLPCLLTVLAVGGAALAASAGGHPVKGAPNCRIFPANNPWNQRADKLPVASNSSQIVKSIGRGTGLHPVFVSGLWDGGPIGIPYTTVGHSQPKVKVNFGDADESDKGPYPIPKNVPIEGGRKSRGDRHALIVDRDACRLYELYALYPPKPGKTAWRCGARGRPGPQAQHPPPRSRGSPRPPRAGGPPPAGPPRAPTPP